MIKQPLHFIDNLKYPQSRLNMHYEIETTKVGHTNTKRKTDERTYILLDSSFPLFVSSKQATGSMKHNIYDVGCNFFK